MLNIPPSLLLQFEAYLQKKAIPKNQQASYKTWLRYYLDFCQKYNSPQTHSESLAHFLTKLQEKRQTKTQQDQASDAISMYYELVLVCKSPFNVSSPQDFSENVSDKTSHPIFKHFTGQTIKARSKPYKCTSAPKN